MRYREEVISALEKADKELRASGWSDERFNGADPSVHEISKTVNGHLFESLLKALGYADCAAADIFRHGPPLSVFAFRAFDSPAWQVQTSLVFSKRAE